jgi:Amt family ammonium transporter
MIFFMQIGFSMLEVGCVQEKSTKNVLIKNALDVCITSVCWATVGHGLAFGRSTHGILGGTTGYFLGGRNASAGFYAAWLFNWTFVSTAATIVSGAVAERIQFQAYASFVLLLSLLLYPLVAHWAWSDTGILSARRPPEDRLFGCGVVDLAGSGVVHMCGGVAALVAIALLGPRDGVTFTPQGRKRAPAGQSAAFQTLGTLCLWFGWFGFNGCSVGHAVRQRFGQHSPFNPSTYFPGSSCVFFTLYLCTLCAFFCVFSRQSRCP